MEKTNQIISNIQSAEIINFDDAFLYAQECSTLLRIYPQEARRIIINILDRWDIVDASCREIWVSLVEAAGFYPYMNKVGVSSENLIENLRKEIHASENISDIYFHEEQKTLQKLLKSEKSLIVSAPTSFGKSLLIEEVVASSQYHNIVIIQPTLALLDETRKKLKTYNKDYNIILRTSQNYSSDQKNLFLLTAERFMEYPNIPHIDFFVIDEFYKLSPGREDNRSHTLNNAFYKLLKNESVKFFLLGPNIEGVTPGFTEKYNAVFFKTNYSLIENNIVDLFSENKNLLSKPQKNKNSIEDFLFKKLKEIPGQTIIYCASPNRVRSLATKFLKYLKSIDDTQFNSSDKEIIDLNEWIAKNIHPQWSLTELLSAGIGIHDGAIPKHITSTIIDLFNAKKINYLFCTSTIIEGVNTSAKNIFIFDKKKGNSLIDYFDFANIKGRAGRMMEHYIGMVYVFNPIPDEEKLIVDIPFFKQNPIEDEVLIHLDKEDVKQIDNEQYEEIQSYPEDERMIFRKNGVSVKGQKKILDEISDINKKIILKKKNSEVHYKVHELIKWNGAYPTYDQLVFIFQLCWKHIQKSSESKANVRSPEQLAVLVMDYFKSQNLIQLFKKRFDHSRKSSNKTDYEQLNEVIEQIYQIQRHWFQYKVPKWLSVFNSLQELVFERNQIKPSNYLFFASHLENGFLPESLMPLYEYGVPSSALKKMSYLFTEEDEEKDVREKALDFAKNQNELLDYEKNKIIDLLE